MKPLKKLLLICAGAMSLAGCAVVSQADIAGEHGKLDGGPAQRNLTISTRSDVSDYIRNQDFDPDAVLAYDLTGKITPQPSTNGTKSGTELIVTKKVVRDANSGTGSLHALQYSSLLYPGALLQTNENLVAGTPTELANLERGKANFEVVLPGLVNNTFSVDKATGPKVRSALYSKIDEWKALGRKLTANQRFSFTKAYSESQLSVDLGFGIKDWLKIDFDAEGKTSRNVYIVSFEQVYYSVNTLVDNDTVIFDDSVTLADVKRDCPDKNPPVLIRQANYGKMIYFKVETDKSKDEISAGFKYAGSFDVTSKAKFTQALDNCTVSCLVFGGSVDEYSSTAPVKGDTTEEKADEINALIGGSLVSDASGVDNAVMLSYATSWLKNNNLAKIGSTTKYLETTQEILREQKLRVWNAAGFTCKTWDVKARKITGWNKDGTPQWGGLETIRHADMMAIDQENTYYIGAEYGQIEFEYDIFWGPRGHWSGRISNKDHFVDGTIKICGSLLGKWIRIWIDGQESRY